MPLRQTQGYDSGDPRVRIHRRSHISSFVICPSRLAAEDKWESGIDPIARERGIEFHRCAEYVMKSQQAGHDYRSVDVEPVIEQADAVVREDVRALVLSWRTRWQFTTPIEVEALAASTILTADESPDGLTHKIGGRIDLTVEPNIVWDWKTAYAVLSDDAMADDIQVGSYALIASDRYGWDKVTVNLAFIRWGVTRSITFTLDEIVEWEQRLKAHLLAYLAWEQEMLQEDPETKVSGPHCKTCPILARCDSASPDAILDAQDADLMGNHLAKISGQSPAMKASLIAWLLEHPDQVVTVGNNKYKLGLAGSHKIEDAQAFGAACEELGIDPWPALSVDKQKVTTLCKKHPRLESALVGLVVDRRKPDLVPIKERQ